MKVQNIIVGILVGAVILYILREKGAIGKESKAGAFGGLSRAVSRKCTCTDPRTGNPFEAWCRGTLSCKKCCDGLAPILPV